MDRNHPAFKKEAAPFFDIVMQGLRDEVDGEHFWDAVAESAIFEFMYNIPGFTNKIEGRDAYMEWFAGYSIILHSADNLTTYKANDGRTITLEYQVHGVVPETGKSYDNRFCSIVTVINRKITYWRDYMDSLAVIMANSQTES